MTQLGHVYLLYSYLAINYELDWRRVPEHPKHVTAALLAEKIEPHGRIKTSLLPNLDNKFANCPPLYTNGATRAKTHNYVHKLSKIWGCGIQYYAGMRYLPFSLKKSA